MLRSKVLRIAADLQPGNPVRRRILSAVSQDFEIAMANAMARALMDEDKNRVLGLVLTSEADNRYKKATVYSKTYRGTIKVWMEGSKVNMRYEGSFVIERGYRGANAGRAPELFYKELLVTILDTGVVPT